MLKWKRLRRLDGSSRFAQAQTTSCGSLKYMVCLFRWSESARLSFSRTTVAHVECGASHTVLADDALRGQSLQ